MNKFNGHILVVDDDDGIRDLVKQYLTENNFLITTAKNAQDAKEKALFRTQRKAVEAGAHGTLDYTIKEGVNKNKIADEKILKSKK